MSFILKRRHSVIRRPEPYRSEKISLSLPGHLLRILATSADMSTSGNRCGLEVYLNSRSPSGYFRN